MSIRAIAYRERSNGDLVIVCADPKLQVPPGWTKIDGQPAWWHRITNTTDVLASWGREVWHMVIRGSDA